MLAYKKKICNISVFVNNENVSFVQLDPQTLSTPQDFDFNELESTLSAFTSDTAF